MKNIMIACIVGLLSGMGGAFLYQQLFLPAHIIQELAQEDNHNQQQWAKYEEVLEGNDQASVTHRLTTPQISEALEDDFAFASSNSTHSVVYIKTRSNVDYRRRSWLELFFDEVSPQVTVSSGSGVIYSQNGFIVTNNHVIEDADQIEVIHNKRSYKAEVIGTDPSTDLAVLKVESGNLPNITLGSSRDLKVGEWVLAVGNPFNLTSTVTAGIVSAKGREINILKTNFPIESFIQTDAAINPGNSGGALVDREGKLVGINTAILSRTGSYAGYGFAVPVDIVRKVVDDIIEYGEVQKAFFGGEVTDLTPELADQLKTDDLEGVAISSLQKNGAAENAGIQRGDIILKVNNQTVNTRSDFEEYLSYLYPGDDMKVVYKRDNKIKTATVELTNREGTTGILKREIFHADNLGADLEIVPKVERELLKINNGIRVSNIQRGLIKQLGIEDGFIITGINGRPVSDPKELAGILQTIRGRVRIEGVNKKGVRGYYSYYF